MSSHVLVDKSLRLEAQFGGFLVEGRAFAEPGVQAHYGPDRGFVLQHLDIHLDIDPEERRMSGEVHLRVAPLASGMGPVEFDLVDMRVDAVLDGEQNPLDFVHEEGRLKVLGVRSKGDTLVVRYHGVPSRGMYFTGPTVPEPDRAHMAWTQCQDEDAHYLVPCLDHPSFRAPFDVHVTAPEGYTVVSNGVMGGREGNTWSWSMKHPVPIYLLSVVVAKLDLHQSEWRGRPVRYLVPEGTAKEGVDRAFEKTPEMLEVLSETYGVEYPWSRYDQVVVHDFIFGGMENVTATTLIDLVLTDERASLDWDPEDLVAHELAHQWFGDFLTCQDWSQGWLNEGWATYSETLWKTHRRGVDEAVYGLFRQLESYCAEDGSRYRRPIVSYLFREPIDLFD
ncbi:MAG: M1 family aminopeptidase, partial [Myxococcota bacterium]|nr:M1 family aminopeptidase [Myxococcota bacterium]